MVKEGKTDKKRRKRLTPAGLNVAFSKTDGTAISFKARVTRSKQPTNNYVQHARKTGRMTVSGGAKKPKKTGGFIKEKRAMPSKGDR